MMEFIHTLCKCGHLFLFLNKLHTPEIEVIFKYKLEYTFVDVFPILIH